MCDQRDNVQSVPRKACRILCLAPVVASTMCLNETLRTSSHLGVDASLIPCMLHLLDVVLAHFLLLCKHSKAHDIAGKARERICPSRITAVS